MQAALTGLFESAGFICKDVHIHERTVENRRKHSVMHRFWIQAVFCMPPGPPDSLCRPQPLQDSPVRATPRKEQVHSCNRNCAVSAELLQRLDLNSTVPERVGSLSAKLDGSGRLDGGGVGACDDAHGQVKAADSSAGSIGRQERAWLQGTTWRSQLPDTLEDASLVRFLLLGHSPSVCVG
jgi:hypothetical protein